MNKKEIILNELNLASDKILDEVIDFVLFLKHKDSTKNNESKLLSPSLSKYKGIAKDIWAKDGQEIVNDMRANDR